LAVLNAEDRWASSLIGSLKSRNFGFRYRKGDVHWSEGFLNVLGTTVASVSDVKLRGRHNLANIAAGVAACYHLLPDGFDFASAISQFCAPEHRIEFVRSVGGVSFYDDSKATNPDSTIVALEAFQEPVVVILGGRNKGMDFAALAEFIKRKSTVKWAVVMGEDQRIHKESLLGKWFRNISEADSLEEAVHLAYEIAAPGDVVLLSPACASFDMFKNFEERGDRFKEIVRKL